MSKRAVLYARVSGDDRQYATSGIESQLRDCRKYAKSNGYQIVGEYNEDAERHTSGAAWLPEIDKIMSMASQGAFDVLIVREIDRLARNRYKHLMIKNQLKDLNVSVEYVMGNFEDSPEGRLLEGLMGEIAEYKRDDMRIKVNRGIINSVEAGNVKLGGRNTVLGYDVAKVNGRRTLVINEIEAAIVILIFDLFVNKKRTLYWIINYLSDNNIPRPGNSDKKRWSLGTLHNILGNETYVGRWYYRKTMGVKDPASGKTKRVKRPRSEWILVNVPAIIDNQTFDAAQAQLKTNKRAMGKQHKNLYVLGGMLKCGHCGSGISGRKRKHGNKTYADYVCAAYHNPQRYEYKCDSGYSYKMEAVETAVWSWVKSGLLDPEQLHEFLTGYQESQWAEMQPFVNLIESSEKRLKQLEKEKDRLIKAYRQGVLTLDDIATQKTAVEKEIADTRTAIANLQNELKPKLLDHDSIEEIKKHAAAIGKAADAADNDRELQRQLYRLLDLQGALSYIDGEGWVDISCVLGDSHLPTSYSTKPYICIDTAAQSPLPP